MKNANAEVKDGRRRELSSGDVFEHQGMMFRVTIERDEAMWEPWKEHDGHGVISEWTRRDIEPGEVVLARDGTSYRYYDVAATVKKAKSEGWGLGPEEEKKLAAGLGRKPTKAEIIAAAVNMDRQRMREWCEDQWWWVYVEVRMLKKDDDAVGGYFETKYRESIGGIESDAGEYLTEVGYELAEEIIARITSGGGE